MRDLYYYTTPNLWACAGTILCRPHSRAGPIEVLVLFHARESNICSHTFLYYAYIFLVTTGCIKMYGQNMVFSGKEENSVMAMNCPAKATRPQIQILFLFRLPELGFVASTRDLCQSAT